ncbi:extended synaptotagmin-like protein 2 isoform X8 [Oratosquilla oratoria]|uniref:extended synaptotagmin-like protein 2 isoform X8 n=1 Tax=Oratosquilla oratoria TaxID=337810 RepID=UPI003F75D1A2
MTEGEVHTAEVADDVGKAYGEWFKGYIRLFGRRCLEWLLVYLFGYYNASFGWLMAPLFFLVLRDKRAKEKKVKFDIVRSLANANEKDVLFEIQRFSNLPSWVTFPDMERVEWLNKIIRQLWPYAGHYVKDLCKYTIEPSIRDALKGYKISGFQFEKIILGDTPPRFSGVKVYDDTSRHEIIMDADFAYAGDCKFEVRMARIRAGIKDLQISGRIRVVMKPLVRQVPLVGGLQVFFLNNPDVDFNLIGVADVFDMPGISDILRSIVIEQIANMMVLPNRFPIQLVDDINVVELKCPMPAGVIRLHVIEAKNLMKMDVGVMGMGKSDPYCILYLGAQKFQTKTINNTVNPKWDYCCEASANVIRRQRILIECWDYDYSPLKSYENDDFLGRANLDVYSIWKNGEMDMWVPLSDAKSGRLHIRATWLDLADASNLLEVQLEEIRALQNLTKNPLHSSVLLVWVDSAKKLNPSHKSIPDPFVRLHVGNSTMETTPRLRTNDPVWEEGFTFLVRNPKTQELKVEVIDQKTGQVQGKAEIDLNTLLREKSLEIVGEEYILSGASGGLASVKLTLTLRVFKTAQKRDDGDGGPKEKVEEIGVTAAEHLKESPSIDEMICGTVSPIMQMAALPTGTQEDHLRKRVICNAGEHNLGRIQLTVKYGPRNNLVIVVHKVEYLQKEEDGELPDPYVKLYLLPDRSKDSKRKTDVIKDDCSPVYDERFEYSVAPNELTQRTLDVCVINKKGLLHFQRSSVMGQIRLDCGLLDPNKATEWYDLRPEIESDSE